ALEGADVAIPSLWPEDAALIGGDRVARVVRTTAQIDGRAAGEPRVRRRGAGGVEREWAEPGARRDGVRSCMAHGPLPGERYVHRLGGCPTTNDAHDGRRPWTPASSPRRRRPLVVAVHPTPSRRTHGCSGFVVPSGSHRSSGDEESAGHAADGAELRGRAGAGHAALP